MFSFLQPRRKVPTGVFARADLHGHWLPGLDGCVGHERDALDLIGALRDAGFRQLYATPTIGSFFPANQPERIREAYTALLPQIRDRWPDLETGIAASYEMDSRFNTQLKKMDFLTLPGQRLLLRFPQDKEPLDLSDMLFRLRIKGFRVMLLQPENIPYYANSSARLDRLRDKEMSFVVGLSSLAGLQGREVQKTAAHLLLNGMAEWTCSDVASAEEARNIREIEMSARLAKRLEAKPCKSL